MAREKLPQNVQSLIGEIGESLVLLRLYLKTHSLPGKPWEVFSNVGESGYDLLLNNTQTSQRVRIEVKTRQKLYTTGKHTHLVQFFLTQSERDNSDFLVACLLDDASLFVVPVAELNETHSNGRPRWRFTVSLDRSGRPNPKAAQYLGTWSRIDPGLEDDM